MAEDFQAEVCGGAWWCSPRTTFNNSPFYGGSCLQNDFLNMKTRSTDEFSGGRATAISPNSAVQVMGSSPSTTTWNQALLVNGTTTYNQTLTEILNNIPADMNQEQTSSFINGNLVATSYGYPSSLLQNLFDSSSPPPPATQQQQQQQQPLYDFQANLDDIDTVSSMSGFSSLVKPKEQIIIPGGLHLANKTPFWNASPSGLNNNRAGFLGSSQSRFLSSMYEEKPNCPNMIKSSGKKSSGDPTFKRPRLETPSPLPTFKVRKEKLGDRVTALQQLVSPFGKTDTASVLHEAIEYIKLLHDQVHVLSTPYMKNGATIQVQQMNDQMKDNPEGAKQQDLRSRGLCLVPVSSTFPVATETAPDYWTSNFGSTFKYAQQ